MNELKIITISAVSGGGKTTVTKLVGKMLNKAEILCFDDYELEGPTDFSEWANRGSDYNEWDIRPIIKDVEYIRRNRKGEIEWVIMDYPFSYVHNMLDKQIAYSVYIDIPLDIAMVRRFFRDKDNAEFSLEEEYRGYMEGGREAYLSMERKIKPTCDMIVDGNQDAGIIAKQIVKELSDKFINY